jgi:hypothetical protein
LPVYVLTAQLKDREGNVRAQRPAPFLVIDPGEDLGQILSEYRQFLEDLAAAEHDEHHPHHHWWQF